MMCVRLRVWMYVRDVCEGEGVDVEKHETHTQLCTCTCSPCLPYYPTNPRTLPPPHPQGAPVPVQGPTCHTKRAPPTNAEVAIDA